MVKARAGARENITPASPPAMIATRIRLKNEKNDVLASTHVLLLDMADYRTVMRVCFK
jgi:hypothetical protein